MVYNPTTHRIQLLLMYYNTVTSENSGGEGEDPRGTPLYETVCMYVIEVLYYVYAISCVREELCWEWTMMM